MKANVLTATAVTCVTVTPRSVDKSADEVLLIVAEADSADATSGMMTRAVMTTLAAVTSSCTSCAVTLSFCASLC